MGFDTGWYSGSVMSGSDEMNQINKKPTPQELREFIKDEIENSDAAVARQKAANEFVALYKPRGYKDTTANARQVNSALNLLGKTNPTIADFEDIYNRLVANGMLDLDQSKLTALQKQEEQQRIAQYLENQFDEEKAYLMPMSQLEARARGR
jgi:16S rRNA U516 pseudouridylate synthase RsuA-like enzyme